MYERVANRREFLGTIGAVGAASMLAGSMGPWHHRPWRSPAVASPALADDKKLAVDGGKPVREQPAPLLLLRAAVL